MTITIHDCRAAGHCVRGVREWFDRHDLDFRDFMRNGIDSQVALATGDAWAIDVVTRKRELIDG